MKKAIIKVIKVIGIVIVLAPVILIALLIFSEIFGMFVNHAATDKQSKQLKVYIEKNINDVHVIDVYSETGNTTGTSNHVDCLSRITFNTKMEESLIKKELDKQYSYYEIDESEGNFVVTVVSEAPFWDNIEGH